MSVDHLSLSERKLRAQDAEVKLNEMIKLLVLQCRVKLMDPEGIIHQARKVVAAADSFEQMKRSIEDDEAEWAYHAMTGE
jgi:hypothetical protein